MSDATQSQGMDRRKFLTVLGVTGGGAVALSGCSTRAVEKLVPYLVQSEDQIPGVATWYATSCTECGAGCGLHVRTREGRAVKLEGNPEHPINRGKLCSRGQASIQGLYNPDRIQWPQARDDTGAFQSITWDDAIARLAARLKDAQGRVAVISGAGRGTFSDLLAEWTTAVGGRLVPYQAINHEPLRAANQRVFGRDELPAHDFAKARYILSFDADFLDTWLGSMENQRGFSVSHGFTDRQMAKHVYFAPRLPLTGLNADEAHLIRPGTEAALALAIANAVLSERGGAAEAGRLRETLAPYTPEFAAAEAGISAEVIRRIAAEFAGAKPSLAVTGGIGGRHRGAVEAAAAVNILNYVAGNVGETVLFGGDLAPEGSDSGLHELTAAMERGEVAVLIVHEANPSYTLPKTSKFAETFRKRVLFKVSTSPYYDETAADCDLLIPDHHALERWGDLRPRAGVHGLMQPVMEPVFATMPTGDVLLKTAQKAGGRLAKFNAPSFEAHLKARWQEFATSRGIADVEAFWHAALQQGGVFDERPAPAAVTLASAAVQYTPPRFDGEGEFVFAPHVSSLLYDGRGTNKPWLLENADPVSKLTWHSWVDIHPDTARRLDVRQGEILRLTSSYGEIEAPVHIFAGIHPEVLSVPLGWGHTEYGRYAQNRGVNALDLLGTRRDDPFLPYLASRIRAAKTGRYRPLATTEGNPRQLGRGIAQAMPFAAARQGLTVRQAYVAQGEGEHAVNTERELEAIEGWHDEQFEAHELGNYAGEQPMWGMAIDLAKCTGCEACVTACYAENNIPIVGEQEVLRGREMTWLRIERYWEGGEDGPPEARFVPMLCQHCDNAPCEPVCPVYAAYHTPDGLNGQVYNRCVGTRYCSNNCPYKVRYFNWYKYNEKSWPEPLNLQLNPDVTVRARGVMEKCTFCIQRIRGAQNEARLEGRSVADGDVVTACAQACPSYAITFGNMRDPESRVSRIKADPRGYHVLEDLNTRPAITYLAKVLHRAEA